MHDPSFYELGRQVEPEWSSARAERARVGIARKAARRRTATVIGSVVVTAALAVLVARVTSPREAPAVAAHAEQVAPKPALTAPPSVEPQKTSATALSADTRLEPEGGRAYVLRAGSARFVVEHDEQHPFTVRAGDVLVEDVGTVFTVGYVSPDRLEVSVTQGSVRVDHDGAKSTLSAGDRLEVDAHAHPVAKAPSPDPETPRVTARDEVAPLLQAADDARAAGQPESAVEPLRRVVKEHPNDSRAGLAAFTLGRVLLDELNRPREAADAFATARARGGPMAADALGREAVARARAGETSRASELADEYLRLYPHGDRVREVERFASGH